MRKLSSLLVIVLFVTSLFSQDKIIDNIRGKKEKGKVIKINNNCIYYEKGNGQTLCMSVNHTDEIIYENGKTETKLWDNPIIFEDKRTLIGEISVEDIKCDDRNGKSGPMKILDILISEDLKYLAVYANRAMRYAVRIYDLNTLKVIQTYAMTSDFGNYIKYKGIFSYSHFNSEEGVFCQYDGYDNIYKYPFIKTASSKNAIKKGKTNYKCYKIHENKFEKINCKDKSGTIKYGCSNYYFSPYHYRISSAGTTAQMWLTHINFRPLNLYFEADYMSFKNPKQDYCGKLRVYKINEDNAGL